MKNGDIVDVVDKSTNIFGRALDGLVVNLRQPHQCYERWESTLFISFDQEFSCCADVGSPTFIDASFEVSDRLFLFLDASIALFWWSILRNEVIILVQILEGL